MDGVRRYHGYFFAWAAIYTLWHHPMENTLGVGFKYMFPLLLQGSLFFTRVQTNRWWTLSLELPVLAHGTLVVLTQGAGLWPLFAFGFGGVFLITQMHGLGWSRTTRALLLLAFALAAAFVFSERGWARLNEIARIPLIDYGLVFLLTWLIGASLWLWRRLPLGRRLSARPLRTRQSVAA